MAGYDGGFHRLLLKKKNQINTVDYPFRGNISITRWI
jgi:hypothetical protein